MRREQSVFIRDEKAFGGGRGQRHRVRGAQENDAAPRVGRVGCQVVRESHGVRGGRRRETDHENFGVAAGDVCSERPTGGGDGGGPMGKSRGTVSVKKVPLTRFKNSGGKPGRAVPAGEVIREGEQCRGFTVQLRDGGGADEFFQSDDRHDGLRNK